jgi:DNA polymerase delta subunit 2
LGAENAEGAFEVIDICYAGLDRPIPKPVDLEDDTWVAFVSGIGFGKDATNYLDVQMMFDYFSGELGCDEVRLNCKRPGWFEIR